MIDAALELLGNTIRDNLWAGPGLAFLAGILTALTPCSLSTVPLIIGYVGSTSGSNTRKAFRLSLTFAGGMAITFTVLGTFAALLGRLLNAAGGWWYGILGALMVLMALQTWGFVTLIPQSGLMAQHPKRGYAGAVLAGMLGGLFASPCATPVLVVLLALVAEQGRVITGVLLLLMYAAGHGLFLVGIGTFTGFTRRLSGSGRYGTFSEIFRWASGGLILLLGLYMFYLAF